MTPTIRSIIAAVLTRGSPDTRIRRAAEKAYDLGLDTSYARLATERNDAAVYRAALGGLGRLHRDAMPDCISEAGYDMAAVWLSLSNDFRGQAILVCLAANSGVDDPGGAPGWMAEYEDPEGLPF